MYITSNITNSLDKIENEAGPQSWVQIFSYYEEKNIMYIDLSNKLLCVQLTILLDKYQMRPVFEGQV